MPVSAIKEFLKLEAAAGIVLVISAALAMVLANTPADWLYAGFLEVPVAVQVGGLEIAKPLLLWINDGLMAIFFMLVGMEIKREVLEGELSSPSQIALPSFAAAGGMIVPAAIFVALNWQDPVSLNGWAIPAATDIAFALGVLALLGPRVPISLKVFLLAVAIIDDLGAIVIIALFYTANLSLTALALAGACLAVLFILNRMGTMRITPYMLVGIVLWICVLKSGVHATLAGVAIGFAIPISGRAAGDHAESPLRHLEHALHPWVAFLILPVFAFANAGVSLIGLSPSDLLAPLPLGIALGLFVGKQIGVFGFSWVAVKAGLCQKPDGATWPQFYGVAMLTGIGFTMSLFIGTLAYTDPAYATDVRIGVLAGSILSAVVGFLILRLGRTASRADGAAGQTA